ncbi:MAG TPA: CinA family protein [Methylotenera sp.]|nr:CinA family protein [Methylotenera sp.]
MDDNDLLDLADQLGAALKARNLTLALAESCTGGMAAQTVTAIAGSSTWFDRGFVTYSNQSKQEMLNVSTKTISTYGAVSEQTATEMALGALKNSHANIAGSITGVAGPDGGTIEKPVGTVCFAWMGTHQPLQTITQHFQGDRHAIRQQAVAALLTNLLATLN